MQMNRTYHRQERRRWVWFKVLYRILGLALTLLGFAVQASGQTDTVKPRPKIGLALSGGAALGFAHIGVLDWFEKHHIPIDYIAGTSMGGLMGGGYATGLTPDELRTTLREIDWNEALSSDPPYRTLTLRRKEDLHDLQSRLAIGIRSGIEVSSGVSPANSIDLLLSRICLPYSDLQSFDELPTPFRCVAVDMQKGEAVALKDGSLATAMRATMAIPGLFTPVKRDGTLYSDGATLNNIPTEAVKAMGADIIIAVDLSASFLTDFPISPISPISPIDASNAPKVKQRSLLEVLSRSISSSTYANERRSLKLADIVLAPDLGGLGGFDFLKVDTFAERGYRAAEARAQILNRFALNQQEWDRFVAQRNARKRVKVPAPSDIVVTGVQGNPARELQRELRSFVGVPIDTARLDKSLTNIIGNGRFDSFQYGTIRSTRTTTEHTGLQIMATPRAYGPPFLRFGVGIDGADTDNIRTNLMARLTSLDLGAQGAELRTDLRVGSDRDLATEYYHPLGNGRPFAAPRIYLQDDSFGLFDKNNQGTREATYRARRAGLGLDIGSNTSRYSQLRFGYLFEHEEASVSTGSRLLPSLHGDVSALRLNWLYDGQDSAVLPTRGTRITATSYWYFHAADASRAFPVMQINLSVFEPVSHGTRRERGDSVFGVLGAGTTFGTKASLLQQFTLGGPTTLAAYGPDAFRGNDSLFVNLGYLHPLAQLPSFLGGRVMLLGVYQAGGAFSRFGTGRYLNDVSAALLAETLFGPVSIGYSYGEAGRNRVFFAIGALFP